MRNAEWKTEIRRRARVPLILALVFVPAFRIPHSALQALIPSRGPSTTATSPSNGDRTAVYVLYRLEIDEYTLLTTVASPADVFPLGPQKGVGRKTVADAYIARMKRSNSGQHCKGTVDGKPVTFTCTNAQG